MHAVTPVYIVKYIGLYFFGHCFDLDRDCGCILLSRNGAGKPDIPRGS